MFDKEKASQYFVVAWVKDWTIRTYLDVISEDKKIEWLDVCKHFPWMPEDEHPFIRNTRVRRWSADAMRSVNDKLWDAADDAARLKLAPAIAAINCHGSKMRVNEARKGMRDSQRALAASTAMNNRSIETMRKGNGSHWGTVK